MSKSVGLVTFLCREGLSRRLIRLPVSGRCWWVCAESNCARFPGTGLQPACQSLWLYTHPYHGEGCRVRTYRALQRLFYRQVALLCAISLVSSVFLAVTDQFAFRNTSTPSMTVKAMAGDFHRSTQGSVQSPANFPNDEMSALLLRHRKPPIMVGLGGVEPPTRWASTSRSTVELQTRILFPSFGSPRHRDLGDRKTPPQFPGRGSRSIALRQLYVRPTMFVRL